MEITSNSLIEQSKLIDSILRDLKSLGAIVKKKKSRYNSNYSAIEISTSMDTKDFFKSFGYDVRVNEAMPKIIKIISGKYKAVVLTFKNNKNLIKSGSQVYCVNTHTEKGSIKNKSLTADALKLAGIQFKSAAMIDTKFAIASNNLKIEQTAILFMKSLYFDVVGGGSSKTINFSDKSKTLYKLIKPQDIQSIGKDFGEILSARWLLNQKEFLNAEWLEFPIISNEALIDYSIKIKNSIIRFSAKFEKGAAPSINSIISNINIAYPNPTQEEKKYIGVLKSLSGVGVSNNILEAMKTLKTASYIELEKIIKSNFNLSDLSYYIRKNISEKYETSSARVNAFKNIFKNVFILLNKFALDDSLNIVFHAKTYSKELASPIISSMGYYLVDLLNKNDEFKKMLNNIVNTIQARQIYLDMSSTALYFKVKEFSNAKFLFAYGANAKDSNNTGIKFKMVR